MNIQIHTYFPDLAIAVYTEWGFRLGNGKGIHCLKAFSDKRLINARAKEISTTPTL
jgi:hypothetical protein